MKSRSDSTASHRRHTDFCTYRLTHAPVLLERAFSIFDGASQFGQVHDVRRAGQRARILRLYFNNLRRFAGESEKKIGLELSIVMACEVRGVLLENNVPTCPRAQNLASAIEMETRCST